MYKKAISIPEICTNNSNNKFPLKTTTVKIKRSDFTFAHMKLECKH